MRREECIDVVRRVPEKLLSAVVLVLRNQMMLSIDAVARFDTLYLVMRGREAGTTDEGMAFFVPYEEISYIKIARAMKIGELKLFYGDDGSTEKDAFALPTAAALPEPQAPMPTPAPTPAPLDPAAIAKQNLLARIRAAKATSAGAPDKLGGKPG